jgi:POT family proton-dependent oligopeptide transporter
VGIWWQALAYLVITVAEILISVTGLELAFVAAPKSMKSFVTAMWLLTVFMANFFINAPVTRLYAVMPPSQYFAMLAVTLVVVAVIFVFVARRFNRLTAEAAAVLAAAAPAGESSTAIQAAGPAQSGIQPGPSTDIQGS